MSKTKAIERILNRLRNMDESADINGMMLEYKSLRELTDKEFEATYELIAKQTGFME